MFNVSRLAKLHQLFQTAKQITKKVEKIPCSPIFSASNKQTSRRSAISKTLGNSGYRYFPVVLPYREGFRIGGCFFYFFSLRQRKGENGVSKGVSPFIK